MTSDIELPTPPDLTNRGTPVDLDLDETDPLETDLRREELEEILLDGAWREGFEEWAQYTTVSDSDVRLAADLGLFHAFDFFWDFDMGRLRYVTPAVPVDWDDRPDSGVSASTLQTELDDLGRAVAETIAAEYVDWGEEESSDLVWGVETFGQVPPEE